MSSGLSLISFKKWSLFPLCHHKCSSVENSALIHRLHRRKENGASGDERVETLPYALGRTVRGSGKQGGGPGWFGGKEAFLSLGIQGAF